jgi:hypothetical protein
MRLLPGIAIADNGCLSESNLEQLGRQATALLARGGTGRQESDALAKPPHETDAPNLLGLPWARRIYDYRKTQGGIALAGPDLGPNLPPIDADIPPWSGHA